MKFPMIRALLVLTVVIAGLNCREGALANTSAASGSVHSSPANTDLSQWQAKVDDLLSILETNVKNHQLPDDIFESHNLDDLRFYAFAVSDGEIVHENWVALMEHYKKVAVSQASRTDERLSELWLLIKEPFEITHDKHSDYESKFTSFLNDTDPVVRIAAIHFVASVLHNRPISDGLETELSYLIPNPAHPFHADAVRIAYLARASFAASDGDVNKVYQGILGAIHTAQVNGRPPLIMTHVGNLINVLNRHYPGDMSPYAQRITDIDFPEKTLNFAARVSRYYVEQQTADLEAQYELLKPIIEADFSYSYLADTTRAQFVWVLFLTHRDAELKAFIDRPEMQDYRVRTHRTTYLTLLRYLDGDADERDVMHAIRKAGRTIIGRPQATRDRNIIGPMRGKFMMHEGSAQIARTNPVSAIRILQMDTLQLSEGESRRLERVADALEQVNKTAISAPNMAADPSGFKGPRETPLYQRAMSEDYVRPDDDVMPPDGVAAARLRLDEGRADLAWAALTPSLIGRAMSGPRDPSNAMDDLDILIHLAFAEGNLRELIETTDQLTQLAIDARQIIDVRSYLGMLAVTLTAHNYHAEALPVIERWIREETHTQGLTPYPLVVKAQALFALERPPEANEAIARAYSAISSEIDRRVVLSAMLDGTSEATPLSDLIRMRREAVSDLSTSNEQFANLTLRPALARASYLIARLTGSTEQTATLEGYINSLNAAEEQRRANRAALQKSRDIAKASVRTAISAAFVQNRLKLEQRSHAVTIMTFLAVILALITVAALHRIRSEGRRANAIRLETRARQKQADRAFKDSHYGIKRFLKTIETIANRLERRNNNLQMSPIIEDLVESMDAFEIEHTRLLYARRAGRPDPVLHPVVVDLRQFITETAVFWQRQITGADIRILVDLDPTLRHVRVDRQCLQTLVYEAMETAVERTLRGIINIRVMGGDDTRTLSIEISDTGESEPDAPIAYILSRAITQELEGKMSFSVPDGKRWSATFILPIKCESPQTDIASPHSGKGFLRVVNER